MPYADLSVHPLPGAMDSEDAVLLADIFPTAYEVGVLNGHVRPGDTVVVVGAGPIGLAAIATARLFTPERIVAVDLAAARLEAARQLGADAVADARETPEQLVADLTDGLGADVVIEAVGVPESFELCTRMVRPGGHVANVGVHGSPRDPASRRPVDQEHHHHDRPGRHLLHPDPAADDGRRPPAHRRSWSPTPSRWTAWRRRTTSSPGPPTPGPSRSCSAGSSTRSSPWARPDEGT